MNILYLSNLSGAKYAGPTYSVPNQIGAQSKIDNVFWYNGVVANSQNWDSISYYHDTSEYPERKISSLPHPFNRPDIIIVEQFYNMLKSPLLRELMNSDIPYIIIPRGELTKQAQARKRLKKAIANFFICKRYSRKATSIHYLTKQEKDDSGAIWNTKGIVIPNGINAPTKTKIEFTDGGIKCIFIGRIEPYHKGLDMLIEACGEMKDELVKSNCTITICGPDKENKLKELIHLVDNKRLSQIVSFHDGVFGKEKEEMLLAHDIFLIPSRFEGHPMSLIEALSYGLPCVATKGSNMRNEIQMYQAGWTADNNVEDLKKALKSMLNSKMHFHSISENAKDLARLYEWDIIAKESHERYLSAIQQGVTR